MKQLEIGQLNKHTSFIISSAINYMQFWPGHFVFLNFKFSPTKLGN